MRFHLSILAMTIAGFQRADASGRLGGSKEANTNENLSGIAPDLVLDGISKGSDSNERTLEIERDHRPLIDLSSAASTTNEEEPEESRKLRHKVNNEEFTQRHNAELPIMGERSKRAIADAYYRYKAECESLYEYDEREPSCPYHVTSVHVDKGPRIKVLRADDASYGAFGFILKTDRPDIVVKVSTGEQLCNEIAVLQAMDGLHGFAPKIYMLDPNDPGIPKYCLKRTVVMQAAGDRNWSEVEDPSKSHSLVQLYRLFEAVQALHATGFRHGDLHDDNIRVSESNPEDVFLVDFGSAKPGAGFSDIYSLCERVEYSRGSLTPIMTVFCAESLNNFSIDFDSWIPPLKRLAKNLDDLTPDDRHWIERIEEKAALLLNKLVKEIKTKMAPDTAAFEIRKNLLRLKELHLRGFDEDELHETLDIALQHARARYGEGWKP